MGDRDFTFQYTFLAHPVDTRVCVSSVHKSAAASYAGHSGHSSPAAASAGTGDGGAVGRGRSHQQEWFWELFKCASWSECLPQRGGDGGRCVHTVRARDVQW